MTLFLIIFGPSAGAIVGAVLAFRLQNNKLANEYAKGVKVGRSLGRNEAFGPGADTLLADIDAL